MDAKRRREGRTRNDNARVAPGGGVKQESSSAAIIYLADRRGNCTWCSTPRALSCGLCIDCWRWAIRDLLLQDRARALRCA